MSQPGKITLENFGYKQELRRTLTTADLIFYGLVFMVPIAPFGIYGIVAEKSGGNVPLVYLIGMIGILFTAFSYWRLAEVFPISGSVYAYTSRGINREIGFLTGWAMLLDYLLIPSLLYIVSATALHTLIPVIPVYAWIVFFICFNSLINIIGIEATAMFNKIAVFLELIVFVIFLGAAVRYITANDVNVTLHSAGLASSVPLGVLLSGVSIAVLSFMGFDGISTLAEETRGGSNSVGKASVISVLIVGTLFIVQTSLATLIWPGFAGFSDPDSAFYDIAGIAGGRTVMWVCALATGLAWGVANSLVAQTAISRILFSMSRDGFLPSPLAKIHPKFQTPYVTIIFIAALSLAITLFFQNGISGLSSIVNFGALTSFLVINFTVVYYFLYHKKSRDWFRHLVCPLIGFIIIAFVWYGLDANAKLFGFAWLAAGVLVLLFIKKVLKRGIDLEI
jgi:Amino acid transporters